MDEEDPSTKISDSVLCVTSENIFKVQPIQYVDIYQGIESKHLFQRYFPYG